MNFDFIKQMNLITWAPKVIIFFHLITMVNAAFEKVQLKMVFILSYLGLKLNPHVF